MRSHRRRLHRRLRAIALGLAASALIVPAAALAQASGDTPADFPGTGPALATPKVGDTPADFPGTGVTPETPKVGDTPADFPGTSGAPDVLVAPITEPGHTIVREVDDELPLILAAAALLIALATAGYALRGAHVARRNVVRPTH